MDSLKEQYEALHREGSFLGVACIDHAKEIQRFIRRVGGVDMIDYGCGAGRQYLVHRMHYYWGVDVVVPYDFAVPEFSKKPLQPRDVVICCDVLEHLEQEQIPEVLDEIFSYAKKGVFLTACDRPARKILPDGRNAHLCIKPKSWWLDVIGIRDVPYELEMTK